MNLVCSDMVILMLHMTCRIHLQSSRVFYNILLYCTLAVHGVVWHMHEWHGHAFFIEFSRQKCQKLQVCDSVAVTHSSFPPCGLRLFLFLILPFMRLDSNLILLLISLHTTCSHLLITVMATPPFFFCSAVIGLYYNIIFTF